MMFSSASMISSFSTLDFLKLSRRSNAFVGGLNAKTNDFGRSGLWLGGLLPDVLTRGCALAGQPLDQRQHFLRV